jgi:hypothetical protein
VVRVVAGACSQLGVSYRGLVGTQDSAVCKGGFVSHKGFVSGYSGGGKGLPAARGCLM